MTAGAASDGRRGPGPGGDPHRALILGCGRLGSAAGRLLLAAGWQVEGLRRGDGPDPGFPVRRGDAGDEAALAGLGPARAVLIAATPGLRRGRDNGVLAAAVLAARLHAGARLVLVSTTAVYADAGGAAVDEDGAVAGDAAVAGLLAIERALAAHADALVLRLPAIVGPQRAAGRERLRACAGGGLRIPGDPERPFPFIHERDAARLCAAALAGGLGRGVLNAASPLAISAGDYWRGLAAREGIALAAVSGDGTAAPSRAIDSSRLRRLWPEPWHGPWDA